MSNKPESGFTHEKVETNNLLMVVLILLVIAVGGMLVMLWNVVMTAWQGKAPVVTIPAPTVLA